MTKAKERKLPGGVLEIFRRYHRAARAAALLFF